MSLFVSRLPVISEANLGNAAGAADQLIQRAVRNAIETYHVPTVQPICLTKAIWDRPALFPLTD
jgi:hypothetical protein